MKTFCVYFIFLIFGYASALTDEEVLLKMAKYLMTCAKGKAIDVADIMKLQQLEIPTKPEVKCLLACTYRNFGTLKDDGMFDLEASYKLAEEVKEGDDKRLENAKKLADICIKVNDESVSDGEKGCDRATLMFKCVVNNAPKLGFKVQLDPSKLGNVMKM